MISIAQMLEKRKHTYQSKLLTVDLETNGNKQRRQAGD